MKIPWIHGMNVLVEKVGLFLGFLGGTRRGNARDIAGLLNLFGVIEKYIGFPILLFRTRSGKDNVIVGSGRCRGRFRLRSTVEVWGERKVARALDF